MGFWGVGSWVVGFSGFGFFLGSCGFGFRASGLRAQGTESWNLRQTCFRLWSLSSSRAVFSKFSMLFMEPALSRQVPREIPGPSAS